MNAWKSKLAGETTTPIRFLSDKDASWAASVGLLFDASALLGGPRLKRAAIVVVSFFSFLFASSRAPFAKFVKRAGQSADLICGFIWRRVGLQQDNKVEQIFVENNPPEVTVSSANSVLAKL
jgi:peroxiredoxin